MKAKVAENQALMRKAFESVGLNGDKAMTNLLQELVIRDNIHDVRKLVGIIQDFGWFARAAGLGASPLTPPNGLG